MHTELALNARRFALTLAVAGIAGLGSIAVAPAASAAPATVAGFTVVYTDSVNGPDAFLVRGHAVRPIFFCESGSMQQHNTCTVRDTTNRLL